MKKVIPSIIATVFLALSFSGFAQENLTIQKFSMGIEAGGGMGMLLAVKNSGVDIKGEDDRVPTVSKILPSIDIAYTLQYDFNKIFSLKTSLGYEHKGGQYVFNIPGYNSYLTYGSNSVIYNSIIITKQFDYLTIPILCKASFGKKIKFFVNAGPYASLLIYSNEEEAGYQNRVYSQKFDAGICLGAGIAIPYKNIFSFSVEARDNCSLLFFESLNSSDQGFIRPNVVNLLVGFNFYLKPVKAKNKK